jgi:hypothetical protein
MVLAKVKGDATEIIHIVDNSLTSLIKDIANNEVVADGIFDLMLSFSNDIGEIIKEYQASKPKFDSSFVYHGHK